MRRIAKGGLGVIRIGLLALGLVALAAGAANAQLIFDGNLMWNNRITLPEPEALADQFLTLTPPPATCPVGYNSIVLGTVTFTHNAVLDPLLPNAMYQTNTIPTWKPAAGSPAAARAVVVPADGFFQQTCYAGAIDPAGADWTLGWTYYDSTGADRQDIHLAGMPDPRPLATYNNVSIYSPYQYFSPDSNYRVIGQLRVKGGATLTVAPGVVIFNDRATIGTIVVERGARLNAVGTACDPIIVTSAQDPGQMASGDHGGIYMLGYARTNAVNSCAGDSAAAEGGTVGYYGGNNDNDGSGVLRYVRVEYAGRERSPNNELNSFTFCGVGRNTRADYLEAFQGDDDGFEWFGGTSDQTHLLAVDGHDDGYDTQMGTHNRAQFVIVRNSPGKSLAGTQWGDKGIEADNTETAPYNQGLCPNQTDPSTGALIQIANATFIGDQRVDAQLYPGPAFGAHWRRGTGYTLLNSIIAYYKTGALGVEHDATWTRHCNSLPADRLPFCGFAASAPTLVSGNVFVARGVPNPFRNQVNVSFVLPRGGPVSVEVFSADGRHVQTLAEGEMSTGPHTVTWSLDQSVPAGMYFYKVLAGNQQVTGKITRID